MATTWSPYREGEGLKKGSVVRVPQNPLIGSNPWDARLQGRPYHLLPCSPAHFSRRFGAAFPG